MASRPLPPAGHDFLLTDGDSLFSAEGRFKDEGVVRCGSRREPNDAVVVLKLDERDAPCRRP